VLRLFPFPFFGRGDLIEKGAGKKWNCRKAVERAMRYNLDENVRFNLFPFHAIQRGLI
jgi:hypothetical protein